MRPSKIAVRLRPYVPFASVLMLWLFFELPTIFRPRGADPLAIRPTADFLALLTAYFFIRTSRHERVLVRLWTVLGFLLVAVRIDWCLCWLITRSRPLFYDQLFLLRHLAVLISDLWSVTTAVVLVLIAITVYAVARLSRVLLRSGARLALPPLRRSAAIVLGAVWAVVIAMTLLLPRDTVLKPTVHYMLPDFVSNVRESYRTYVTVRDGIFDSPYKRYGAIRLSRRPNVSFFFVESYGRIIPDSPDMSPTWLVRLNEMQRVLEADGWQMASGFSTAPVSGGRSWLAVGSIFTGASLPYEAVFRHLVQEVQSLPTVVSFFKDRGYDTIALEPSDRVRPGVEETNYYHVEHPVHFDDLHYKGPRMGWGLVPDQFSLGFAEEKLLADRSRPRFFLFHMVTSHLPWSDTPPIVDDWHDLDHAEGEPITNSHGEDEPLFHRADQLSTRLRRYGREEMLRWVRYPGVGDALRERYVETVNYDLKILERHLLREHSDELIIVMGDHQPPAVAPDGENFDVPVHVFARDPALLAEFRERGFSPGLVIDPRARPAIQHAGLFSLLVRTMVRLSLSAERLPAYLPNGVPLAG